MANSHVTEAFDSSCRLECTFIDFKTLVQSYVEVAGDHVPAWLYVIQQGVDVLENALVEHQTLLHSRVAK